MDSNNLDLDAFESNPCAGIWARELGKNAALVFNIQYELW